MVEAALLADLQIKRRQLENELTSLSSKELELVGDIQKLEKNIIAQLEEKIEAEKKTLGSLEAQKSDLEKKLSKLENDKSTAQGSKKSRAKSDAKQECPNQEVEILCIAENAPERIADNKKRKTPFF